MVVHHRTSGAEIIQAFVYSEMKLQVKVWFARVPTSSNISDGPSRLETTEMQRCGAKQKQIHWRNLLDRMGGRQIEIMGFQNGILRSVPSCVSKKSECVFGCEFVQCDSLSTCAIHLVYFMSKNVQMSVRLQ